MNDTQTTWHALKAPILQEHEKDCRNCMHRDNNWMDDEEPCRECIVRPGVSKWSWGK